MPHMHERRPHAFVGRLTDAKCQVCHLDRHGSDEIHSNEAIRTELQRLWALEDSLTADDFHRIRFMPDNYFMTHTLDCRIEGLHKCAIQHRLTKLVMDGFPLPEPGEYHIDFAPDAALPGTLAFYEL